MGSADRPVAVEVVAEIAGDGDVLGKTKAWVEEELLPFEDGDSDTLAAMLVGQGIRGLPDTASEPYSCDQLAPSWDQQQPD